MPFPLDEKYIIETERELNYIFPEIYRNKMKESNGGEIIINDDDWQLHPFLDKSDNKRISRTCNDIIKETKLAREWNNFPTGGISIGTNGYGDHLLLLNNKKNFYIWDHETGELEEILIIF
jgi:hypothetical protein